ncbi:MAG: hypothetical protein NLN66_04900, partial [Candidatus Thalassarchaeaceae archaeon]|nr:hypothetical protein [Candidatus Thalassarchaeaceae archaeon]
MVREDNDKQSGKSFQSVRDYIPNMNSDSVKDAIIHAPNTVRRSLSGVSGTQALVKLPVLTIVLCLLVTGFFTMHSGAIDCRDGFNNSICKEE